MAMSPTITRRLSRPGANDRGQGAKRAYVVVLAGERMGECFTLNAGRTTIGRGVTTDIRINDEGISRTHAAVLHEDDVYYLTDAGSTNGTFANGDRVTRYPLREGDRIQLGASSVLRFTYQLERSEEPQRVQYETALRDPLTGLFNRSYLRNRLESDVASALRHGKPLSLVVFDPDQLTEITAEHGERAAGRALRELARHVREITRRDDLLARWSRDGFALVCRAVDALRAARAATRIRESVAARRFADESGREHAITVSLGVADLGMLREPTAEALAEAADTALFVAKRNGQNRVEIYDPENEPTRHV